MLFGLIIRKISRENKIVYLNSFFLTLQRILVVPLIRIYNK